MSFLAGSLADGVLGDAILIPPSPTILPTNTRKVMDHRKKYRNHEKKEMLGWLNASLQSTGTRDKLSTTLYLQSM